MITAKVDLRGLLHPVRHQGRRNACLAFATSCAHEARSLAADPLCVEYLYYHAAARMTYGARRGLTITAAADALSKEGQPTESAWPYTPDAVDPWTVPVIDPPFHKAALAKGQAKFDWVVDQLDAGKPVVLGLVITEAFLRPDPSGVIDDGAAPKDRGGHAVLAVGHGTTDEGEDAVLIRNSWGPTWGLQGHAWLPRPYIQRQLHETAVVT